MQPRQAFMDESRRDGYFVCAVALALNDLAPSRQALQKLRKPGQRRIHMATEGARRRRAILSAVIDMGIEAYVYQASLVRRPERHARNDCLRAAVPDLVACGTSRLIVESCDQDHDDRLVLYEAVEKAQATDSFTYAHGRPASEPLLWLPDIVAWAYGKGGDWRRRVGGTIVSARLVGP